LLDISLGKKSKFNKARAIDAGDTRRTMTKETNE
jgi:hypothetical protein